MVAFVHHSNCDNQLQLIRRQVNQPAIVDNDDDDGNGRDNNDHVREKEDETDKSKGITPINSLIHRHLRHNPTKQVKFIVINLSSRITIDCVRHTRMWALAKLRIITSTSRISHSFQFR